MNVTDSDGMNVTGVTANGDTTIVATAGNLTTTGDVTVTGADLAALIEYIILLDGLIHLNRCQIIIRIFQQIGEHELRWR